PRRPPDAIRYHGLMRTDAPPLPSWRARAVGGLLLLLAVLPGSRAVADEGRAAVPDPAARANAIAELKKQHRVAYESKDPEVRRALARTLIDGAGASEGDAVRRYVLLDQALAL